MADFLDLEEIVIDDDSAFEDVEFRICKYPFPALYYGESNIYFNRKTTDIFRPKKIKFRLSTEYLIVLPAENDEQNAFSVWDSTNKTDTLVSTLPASLKNRRALKRGTYKCYRYKNGLAIKRYEPLEVKGDD